MEAIIENNKASVYALCQRYNVDKLFVFGSASNGSFTADSDVDILIDITENDPVAKGETIMKLWSGLEHIFKARVDLLISGTIKNPYLQKQIDTTKQLVYDRQGA